MNNKTVRGLGLTALGMIAAVAIACGGSSDKSDGGGFSTGGFGGGEAVGGDDARGRDLDILLGEQSVANTAPQEAPAGVVVDGAAGPAGIPTSALRSIDRKIIQTASLQLQVEEVGVAAAAGRRGRRRLRGGRAHRDRGGRLRLELQLLVPRR